MEQLKTVLAINPRFTQGIIRVADLSLETKKYDQALEYYSKLIGDEDYKEDAIIGLANTYYEMSRDEADSNTFTTNKELPDGFV